MPTYTVLDKTTKEEYDVVLSYDEFMKLLEDKNFQQVFTKMNYAYRIGRVKVSESWRSRLKEIQKISPGHNITIP